MSQCSTCEMTADLVASGEGQLEAVADVLGFPAPSLHRHLVGHDQEGVLRVLTYGGEPILPPLAPKLEETTVVVDEPTTSPAEREVPVTPNPAVQWPENVDPQEFVDAGLIEADGDIIDAEIVDLDSLAWLMMHHDDARIRDLAQQLVVLVDAWEAGLADRRELELLVAERDHLNDRIEKLAARLGDREEQPAADPAPTPAVDDETPAVVRAWCRDNGVYCPATGRIPRSALDAYRQQAES